MEEQIGRLGKILEVMSVYGRDVVTALIILVGGLIAIRLLMRLLSRALRRVSTNQSLISTVTGSVHIVLLIIVVSSALNEVGVDMIVVRRLLLVVMLAAVGLIVLARPYLPRLPFKVGNTVQAGGLLGKVEATTFLNTRLKTFDGKAVFIPNRVILNDIVVNYHFTPERQIRLAVTITYSSDLLKAKKVIAEILAEDPRILNDPAARVFVLNLAENGVEIAARPWVNNLDYWRTRCDLLEKIKLRLDQEGITLAMPQRVIHPARDIEGAIESGERDIAPDL